LHRVGDRKTERLGDFQVDDQWTASADDASPHSARAADEALAFGGPDIAAAFAPEN
jgi:hypothetical protein